MLKVLITGKNGQLGSTFQELSSSVDDVEFIFKDSKELDITVFEQVKEVLLQETPDVVINCAAYTAVDRAEEAPEQADRVNHLGVHNLALTCKDLGIGLIHISTDYVFDGTNHRPYLESDLPNPQSVYGKSKLAGEEAMKRVNPSNSIIIRTSWVYSPLGNNFVKTMLRLAKERTELNVVADQIGTPTYAKDLAKTILQIVPQLNNEQVEVYHYSNEGACSWYDFAKAIFELKKIDMTLNPIESEQYPTPAKRPFYSVMNKNKIKEAFSMEVPHWREALKDCLKKL